MMGYPRDFELPVHLPVGHFLDRDGLPHPDIGTPESGYGPGKRRQDGLKIRTGDLPGRLLVPDDRVFDDEGHIT